MAHAQAGVEHDIEQLLGFIRKLGNKAADGTIQVTFGTLFKDDALQNTLESLAGTLKAAKRRGHIKYGPELLLQGSSDKEIITLVVK